MPATAPTHAFVSAPAGARHRRPPHFSLRRALLALLAAIAPSLLTSCVSVSLPGEHAEKEIRYELTHQFAVEDPQFLRSMSQLLGPPLTPGNRVTAYQNGDEIFPAMLEAIRGARESITFETFIYWSGEIGREFSEALSERARAGVKVHVLLDWLGSNKLDAKLITAMREAGVEVERYHPLKWYTLSRINHRTHRKILVVDGRVGFTGGVGIGDPWTGRGDQPDHWRDSHYRLEGPAVAQMQAAFGDNWLKTRAQVLFGRAYYPELQQVGPSHAQVFKSSSTEGSESVRLMYLLSIASTTKHIRLQAAYFIPDDLSLATLLDARRRGVTIEIIVPGPNSDSEIVKSASRSRWGPLLDAGVQVYEFQPAMYHCKVLIVDDVWVSVGSTNFDNRSFRLNDEENLNIYDPAFAAAQVKVFESDRARSRRMTRQEFNERSTPRKVLDALAGVLRGQL